MEIGKVAPEVAIAQESLNRTEHGPPPVTDPSEHLSRRPAGGSGVWLLFPEPRD